MSNGSAFATTNNYNPDVLTCLANLSNDEIFTPPSLANKILDLLPEEIWHDKTATFLDPATKSGVFLREITARLIKGLEHEIPDLQERINHICKNQVFGVAITELTGLLSRRSLYCSKLANGEYSICTCFEYESGNVKQERVKHTWKDGKCIFCGASEGTYDRDEMLENYAYQFIHTKTPEEIFNMKFDVIVGNPPYQLSDGGNNASAVPIYNLFVEQAKKLNPTYVLMIIPARWYCGGRGLDSFRNNMLTDNHLKEIHDFKDTADCFPGLRIGGGVCYFLWSKHYNSNLVKIVSHDKNGVLHEETRPTLEKNMDMFIRDSLVRSIIKKIELLNDEKLSSSVLTQKPYGFRTNFRDFVHDGDVKIYTKKVKCGFEYIMRDSVTKNTNTIDQWKVVTSRSTSVPEEDNGQVLRMSQTFIAEPGSVVTESYVVISTFDSEIEAKNCLDYVKSKFFRLLCQITIVSPDVSPRTFVLVPLLDFSKSWTDEKLYARYSLSDAEIDYIETNIKKIE